MKPTVKEFPMAAVNITGEYTKEIFITPENPNKDLFFMHEFKNGVKTLVSKYPLPEFDTIECDILQGYFNHYVREDKTVFYQSNMEHTRFIVIIQND